MNLRENSHLVTGAERLQILNDTAYNVMWQKGLEYILRAVSDKRKEQSNRCVRAVDASDGSMISIMLAKKIQHFFQVTDCGHLPELLQIFSLEKKQFSSFFFSQLVENNGLSDTIQVYSCIDDMISVWSEENPREKTNYIDVLFSECYYYQLNTQPTWQATSFYYLSNMLKPKFTKDAIIVPARARIMCAAATLPDLCRCHGIVDRWITYSYVFPVLQINALSLF